MKRHYIVLLLCLLSASALTAQSPLKTEYGKPSEMKGITKIFVDTDGDMEERQRMVAEFEKARIPRLDLLDSSDGAEVILYFAGGKVAYNRGYVNNGVGAMGTDYRSSGRGMAFIPKPLNNSIRILLSVESVKDYVWTAKPSTKFAREFIKAYKEANSLK